MKKVALLFLFTSFLCFGQNKSISKKDSLTISKYRALISQHINPNPDSALYYIKKIRTLSSKLNYDVGMVEADYLNASYYRRIQNSDSAIYYFKNSLRFAKNINYKKGIAKSYNGLCHVYYRQGNLNSAINECNNCLEVAKLINDLSILPDSYIALGNIYLRKNDLKQALRYDLKVDSIHNIQKLRPDIIAAAYQSIGVIYLELGQLNKSEEYFLKANIEFKNMPTDPSYYLNTTKWHLGELYFKQGNFKRSDSILLESYKFFNKIKDNRTVAEISKYLGLINLKLNNNNKAEVYFLDAYYLHKEFQNEYEVSFTALELGKLYNKIGKPKKAIEILNQTLQLKISQKNSFIKQEIYLILANAYAKEKQYNNAYFNIQKGLRLKDSLQESQNIVQISEIEEKYQSEKKEKEIVLLTSQKELTEHQKKNQRNILLSGIGLTTMAGLFFFFLYRNRQKTSKKLLELDRAKSTFFANISHEFRTPLTLISGPIQKQLKKKKLSIEDRNNLEMIQRNSNRLLSLVDQLLDISKIETGSLKLSILESNILQFINTLVNSFTFLAKQKNINYITNINNINETSWFDKDVIEKVVVNILSNAFKYTPNNGSIVCNAYVINNTLFFEVKNTGKGLTKEEIKKIFNRFYQINKTNQGVGLGLSLVKQLITLHQGSITVESTLDEWTIFKVKIPTNKESFNELELKNDNEEHSPKTQTVHSSENEIALDSEIKNNPDCSLDTEKPILLIVDDNKDIRNYVSDLFKGDYRTIQAVNGKKGIDAAFEHIPDLVICDVMMPVKNGIELCEKIKTDERTSHIPIILLTAKTGEENEIEGVKTGADDYTTKPFNDELLILKVEKLLENRKKLQDRYSQEIILKPKDIAVNSTDEIFLERIQTILDENLIEPSFNVEGFSNAMAMSRMQLHRKIKGLTGLTASEFIRSQRLKLAIQLLEKTDGNVSQIGYSVGFNNHAYFSKCFKDAYNCSPSEYLSKKK